MLEIIQGWVQRGGGESEKYPALLEDYNLYDYWPKTFIISVRARILCSTVIPTAEKISEGPKSVLTQKAGLGNAEGEEKANFPQPRRLLFLYYIYAEKLIVANKS